MLWELLKETARGFVPNYSDEFDLIKGLPETEKIQAYLLKKHKKWIRNEAEKIREIIDQVFYALQEC
jgi:hypothetical protein